MSDIAISEDVAKKLLDKWGIKHCSKLELSIVMEPDTVIKVKISKNLSISEINDVTEVLQEYHLTKIQKDSI